MVSKIKKIIPQKVINIGYHFPKAFLARSIYRNSNKKIKLIGVTGTDGKTTTVNMIYHILNEMDKNVSMISTVYAAIGKSKIDTGTHVSSPGPFSLQRLIKKAINLGTKYMILEVTSHGLDQFRFWGLKFDIGVVTNVTHEHLDYHKNFENYLKAKSKLIQNSKVAILNIDDPNYDFLLEKAKGKVVSFGLSEKADINPKKYNLKLKIPGDYNLLNALAATAVALSLDIKFRIIQKALQSFELPTGRLQYIPNNRGLNIVIDFAHTPNGLTQALTTLKSQTKGRLISIIGAEGLRDLKKRPLLGSISKKIADYTIITAVDPRGDLEIINKQILEGALKSGATLNKDVFIINDRQEAIDYAIKTLAKKGDTIGIFGKGHETTMDLDGEVELPWSDVEAVKIVLNG